MVITPGRLLAMNLAGSAGESLMPFIFGAFFERGYYGAFGTLLCALNVVVLTATFLARATALGPGGLPVEQLVSIWERPFATTDVAQGGCPDTSGQLPNPNST